MKKINPVLYWINRSKENLRRLPFLNPSAKSAVLNRILSDWIKFKSKILLTVLIYPPEADGLLFWGLIHIIEKKESDIFQHSFKIWIYIIRKLRKNKKPLKRLAEA